ncbi:photosynthetic reaction center cytochrome PufC [Stappia sp.]|uniref:photosynthetic reaction center cytochrome PufC n=1 Tax=Stappia sp. TaxID=1870903 RepID=UPI0032D8C298
MNLWLPTAAGAGALLAAAAILGADWDLPPVDTEQVGYRGTGMYVSRDREKVAELQAANVVPPAPWEADPEGERASEIYENVQVLGDLSSDQFNQFMAAITEWVSPEQGCVYCHNEENFASDDVYTKVVSRRMIQMTQAINEDWTPHVQDVGVTCYTCHRGMPVPANVWSRDTSPEPTPGMAGYRAGQNVVAQYAGNSSLPQNALEDYLLNDMNIRVHSNTALPMGDNPNGTKETENTWSLMMHMSESLGTNCMACHNSRAFNDWDQSPPQRVSAWHGIRMAREINTDYMVGLTPVFPDNRLGPAGDVLKVNCATCHNGVQKPLYGVSMLQDYVDAISRKTETGVPDFDSYVPGETEVLGPAAPGTTSSLEQGAAEAERDVAAVTQD